MWANLATNVVSAAASHFLSKPDTTQNGNKGGNYNIRGYINNLPVDLEVERADHSSGGSRFTQPPGKKTGANSRPSSSSGGTLALQNCNTSSSVNTNKAKKQQGNFKKKPGDEKSCKIVLPSNGNFEINIRKFENDFAGMNMSNSKPNSQKVGSNNTFRQKGQQLNVNQNQQRNGQPNKVNGYQNKPYDNQNKPYISGKQNFTAKSQNERQVKYQNQPHGQCNYQVKIKKDEKVKHHKPGELKFPNKNNLGKKNIASLTHHNRNGTWMYLGRLTAGTTDFTIENYLNQKFPGHVFIVETLPLYKDAKLPCFKVKVDDRIFDEFQNLEHWPAGVKISKYIENFRS